MPVTKYVSLYHINSREFNECHLWIKSRGTVQLSRKKWVPENFVMSLSVESENGPQHVGELEVIWNVNHLFLIMHGFFT
jgi:hypothetical protein